MESCMTRTAIGALVVALLLAAASYTGAGIASAANEHDLPPPEVFMDTNPCTGDLVEITETFKKAVFHSSEDANGGFHVTGTLVADIETEDGFSGRSTLRFSENGSGDASHFVGSFTYSATLGNGSGQRVVVHTSGHITVANGEVKVEHESFSLECRGKPV
jgi:hypothetical protein